MKKILYWTLLAIGLISSFFLGYFTQNPPAKTIIKTVEQCTTRPGEKACIDKGGIPIFDGWTGFLKDCKKL